MPDIKTIADKADVIVNGYAYPFVHALVKPIVINKTIGTQNPIYIGPKT